MARSRYALLLILAMCDLSGCSTLRRNTEIVRLDTQRDTSKASDWTRAGIHLYEKGHVSKATSTFEKAIAADETYGPAHNNLGLLHFDQRDLYQAAWSFQRAIEFMPQRAEPVNNLGLTLESAGSLDEAIEQYYTAYAMEPANPEYLGNLTRARMRRGDRDDTLGFELQRLIFIDVRPEWIDWAEDQLALVLDKERKRSDRKEKEDETDETDDSPELLPIPMGEKSDAAEEPPAEALELPFQNLLPPSEATPQSGDE